MENRWLKKIFLKVLFILSKTPHIFKFLCVIVYCLYIVTTWKRSICFILIIQTLLCVKRFAKEVDTKNKERGRN